MGRAGAEAREGSQAGTQSSGSGATKRDLWVSWSSLVPWRQGTLPSPEVVGAMLKQSPDGGNPRQPTRSRRRCGGDPWHQEWESCLPSGRATISRNCLPGVEECKVAKSLSRWTLKIASSSSPAEIGSAELGAGMAGSPESLTNVYPSFPKKAGPAISHDEVSHPHLCPGLMCPGRALPARLPCRHLIAGIHLHGRTG